jgi:DNA repair exonuclease SbcCD nuclease subunit
MTQAHSLKVPIFFPGDIFHTPDGLSNSLMSLVLPKLLELFYKYPVDMYAISGNHDLEGLNSYTRRSSSYITTLSNTIKRFHVIDFDTEIIEDMALHGVPYINFNEDYADVIGGIKIVKDKFNILMNHCDYKGQKDTNGIIIGRGENITKGMFKKFDLVISGHVHKPGHLFGNVYSIGSPFQQRLSDMGGEFGYWTLKKSFKMKFHELQTPKFRFYEDKKEINNLTDYWVKKPKENVTDDTAKITMDDLGDKRKILKRYLRYIHNRSKSKARIINQLLTDVLNDTV